MTKPLATFKFNNNDFDITEQSKNNLYLKIYRQIIINNQNKIPAGAIAGTVTNLQVLHEGQQDCDFVWQLKRDDNILATGYTSDNRIPLPMYYGDDNNTYTLSIFSVNKISKIFSKKNKSLDIDTYNKLILLQMRYYIISQLKDRIAEGTIRYGSKHLDASGNNNIYIRSIRIDIPDHPLHHIYLYFKDNNYFMDIYTFYGSDRDTEQHSVQIDLKAIDNNINYIIEYVSAQDTFVSTVKRSSLSSL